MTICESVAGQSLCPLSPLRHNYMLARAPYALSVGLRLEKEIQSAAPCHFDASSFSLSLAPVGFASGQNMI